MPVSWENQEKSQLKRLHGSIGNFDGAALVSCAMFEILTFYNLH